MTRIKLSYALLATTVMMLAISPLPQHVQAYSLVGAKWGTTYVPYYVNPRNIHVSESAAISAIQTAADAWHAQSGANIQLGYAGYTSGTSAVMNNKNEIFFRDSNGSYIAQAYYWWDSSNTLIDADIVFYEGAYQFFVNSGCSGSGVYLEDVAIHEFGHFLGLRHTDVAGATMAPNMPSWCDRTQLTLEADDISGIQALYPPTSATVAQPPAAPSNLAAGSNASAPTSSLLLSWADNASNESGYRVERSRDNGSYVQVAQLGANTGAYTDSGLSAGATYYYRVYAFNGDGPSPYSNLASAQTASEATAAPSGASLTVSAYKVKGQQKADLKWSGLSATSVTVHRNGSVIATVANSGAWTDTINGKGSGSYTYKVCGVTTLACSNDVSVKF